MYMEKSLYFKSYVMRVVFEIELDADDPLEAAKMCEDWIKYGNGFQYYCQRESTGEIFSVDLDEEEGQEVVSVDSYKPLIQ